jgi:KDO2-lipid IV(A) lauroyltransferase
MHVRGKWDSLRSAMRVMREGHALGLLMDQDGSAWGVFVPFFGKLASTVPTAARLARRTGAAIVPVTSYRLRSGTRHRLRVGPEVEVSRTDYEERDVLLTTYRCNRALERAILAAPAQWLWSHHRWRSELKPEHVRKWREAIGDRLRP